MRGRINSFQSMGAVDGPGIRFVVFMQGCPLRCIYCHNPETWSLGGEEYSVDDVVRKILRYRPYFGEEGGVTVSGGEPLLQWEFVTELFRRLKAEGIHTALDTSGTGSLDGAAELLSYTDLVLCDLKFSSEEDYREYCSGSLEEVLSFLKLTEQMRIPLWIRHVVVPGLTDSESSISRIMEMSEAHSNLCKLERLPLKKLCISKYEALGIPFLL
jgi:pyruvate formate lyase activating enzyme